MKNLFILLTATFSFSAQAADFDGCYLMFKQVLKKKEPASVFCLKDTAEGEGARMTIFGVHGRNVSKCDFASEVEVTDDSLDFILEGKTDLAMSGAKRVAGKLEGFVKVGSSAFRFEELESEKTEELENAADSSAVCKK